MGEKLRDIYKQYRSTKDEKRRKELWEKLRIIICPKCDKSIVINSIKITCPYCNCPTSPEDTIGNDDLKGLFSLFVGVFGTISQTSLQHSFIFDQCMKCHRVIKYLSCPHCNAEIEIAKVEYKR